MSLSLKELNTIAQNQEKNYSRKNQAIEYILSQNEVEKRIGKYISLREMFKLMPLPEYFSSLNLNEIAKGWRYHSEEVKLLIETFRNSYYIWRELKDKEMVKGYSIEPHDNSCPCAIERASKKYPKSSPPKVPFHIGCNCFLNKEYDFD